MSTYRITSTRTGEPVGTLRQDAEDWVLTTPDADLRRRWARYGEEGIIELTESTLRDGVHTDRGTITPRATATLAELRRALAPLWRIT